ncbi:MAG: PBP1A family penicillin-binding protein [Chloroflexi bacterium]|nr:PBP1A family penicillin-binding protein [Chloroflexota bacterium]
MKKIFRLRRRNVWLALLALVTLVIGAGYFFLFSDLPAPDALLTRVSPDTTKIFDRNGKLLYEILDPLAGRRTRVTLDDLPASFKNAVIAVEDANFYANPGVDVIGVARALVQYVQEGQIVSGGSTITQQLARTVLLTKAEKESRTVTRKLREMVLALRITQTYSKDQILEMYLNEVYFGNLAYGIEAAARTYFGKPARDLDLAESAMLAGLIQSPAAYDPYVNPAAGSARQRVALDLMVKRGAIAADDAQLAQNETLHFKATDKREIIRAPHFVAYVRNLLEQQYGADTVNRGGLRVTTTLDLDLQQRAEAIVKRHVQELKDRTRKDNAPDYNLNDAALAALKPDSGEIIAMVGSADYFDASIDGAVNVALALRQPGSSIKPITYATAFAQTDVPPERLYTAATVLSDVPTTFQTKENEPYAPQNFDRQWHGPLSLRAALATSNNMIAVKVLEHVGLDAMISTAKALGISTFDDPDRFGLALTLGGGEVKLLELTAAYAGFANQGNQVVPIAILQVDTETGTQVDRETSRQVDWTSNPVTRHPDASSRTRESSGTMRDNTSPSPVTPQVAYLITSILSDNYARIPAFGEASVLNLSRPAAAKTGTTTDFRDNWTLGYTPDLAVGVWAGNADNTPMYRVTGISGAGPIWHDFMEEALRGIPEREFAVPDGLVEREICDAAGLLATPDCARVRREIFIQGTEPTRQDNAYQSFMIDAATGNLWADGCQGPRVPRVFRIYPPDAQDWAKKKGLPQAPEVDCLGRVAGNPSNQSSVISDQSSVISGAVLEIVSPAQNSEFETSPQLPASLQQVEVSARLNRAVALRQVTLYVDDVAIGEFTGVPYRALWQLTPGIHRAQAIGITTEGETIESDAVRFVVKE